MYTICTFATVTLTKKSRASFWLHYVDVTVGATCFTTYLSSFAVYEDTLRWPFNAVTTLCAFVVYKHMLFDA